MRLVGGSKSVNERKYSRRMRDVLVDECKALISVTGHTVTKREKVKKQEP